MRSKGVYIFKNCDISNSSSGGAFPTIEKVLRNTNKKLIVYGAAFDSDMNLKHKRAINENETISFRGSKYIESNIVGINKLIEKDLIGGDNTILFTGTPCQVAGVEAYIKTKNLPTHNLYMVDLLCHGTPNPKYWNDYKKWLERRYKSKLISYSFRSNGKIEIKAEFKNGLKLKDTNDLKLFFDLYNSPKMLQDRCFKCPYVCMKNKSDITIGDCWGIEHIKPDFSFNMGVSLIISNNSKGNYLLNLISEFASENEKIYIDKCNNDDFIKYNPPLTHATKRTKKTDEFKKNMNKGWNYLYFRFCVRNLLVNVKRKLFGVN